MAKKDVINKALDRDRAKPTTKGPEIFRDSRDDWPPGIKLSKVYYVKPGDLKTNPLNDLFKTETPEYFEALGADIEKRGILVPLIAKPEPGGELGKSGVLLAGHNRLKMALKLKLEKIPVQYVLDDLEPEQERAFVIKDNFYRRQLTADDRLNLYRALIPDFDKRIQIETRGGDRKSPRSNLTKGEISAAIRQGKLDLDEIEKSKGNVSPLIDNEPAGLTADEISKTATAAGIPVTTETAKKDKTEAKRKAREAKPKEAPDPEKEAARDEARRLKAVETYKQKIKEALNGATDETTDKALVALVDLIEILAGENDDRISANIEAIRAALKDPRQQ